MSIDGTSSASPNKRHGGEGKNEVQPVMFQIRRIMNRLVGCDDITCGSCVKDLRRINKIQEEINMDESIPWKIKLAVSRQLVSLGALELFEHIWSQCFSKPFLEQDTDENDISVYYDLLYCSAFILMNITDGKREAGQGILDLNLHVDIVRYLSSDYLDFANYDLDDPRRERIAGICYVLLGIIYNIVQEITDAREMLRQFGVVQVLEGFRYSNCPDFPAISRTALFIQAWLNNGTENERLNSDGRVFNYLVEALESTIYTGCQRYHGFRRVELLNAVNKLIANNENKVASVEAGILPIYVRVLNSTEAELMDERLAAIEGIWTLSDHCVDAIKQEAYCTEVLQEISTSAIKEGDLKTFARIILNQLGLPDESCSTDPLYSTLECDSVSTSDTSKDIVSLEPGKTTHSSVQQMTNGTNKRPLSRGSRMVRNPSKAKIGNAKRDTEVGIHWLEC